MIRRRYEITVEGEDQLAFDTALAEAIRRIKEGNLSGFDENEESRFSFLSSSLTHVQD